MSSDVSSVRNFRSVHNGNGIRGRVKSGRGWVRGQTENSVRRTRGRGRVGKSGLLISERSNVSSVRNGNGIRGRVESGRGWARGQVENSVRKTRGRGRVGKSGLLANGLRSFVVITSHVNICLELTE